MTAPTPLQPTPNSSFAFLVHPLVTRHLFKHPALHWMRRLPEPLVERLAHSFGPMRVSRVTGARSATGVEIQGSLYTLTSTPRMLMSANPEQTYNRILKVARWAEDAGERILGLGAYTSIVGDAGVTIARRANIAITSGSSFTVASTLETASQASSLMGRTLEGSRVMVIGATGSIGAACCRLLARDAERLHMVAPRAERLAALRSLIEAESPNCRLTISSQSSDHAADADVIITTTSARGARLLDIMQVKPGCIICDVARPLDISAAEASQRPDVLVIESGELLVPGALNLNANIGLPRGVAYACLSETLILAMEGRFDDYSVGRDLDIERVKEIRRLGARHGFRLAPLRSFGVRLTSADIASARERTERASTTPHSMCRRRTALATMT